LPTRSFHMDAGAAKHSRQLSSENSASATEERKRARANDDEHTALLKEHSSAQGGDHTEEKANRDDSDENAELLRWVKELDLEKHIEGGYFRQHYESPIRVKAPWTDDPRSACNAIYFALGPKHFSCFHRLCMDEIWHLYRGTSCTIRQIRPSAEAPGYKLVDAVITPDAPSIVVPAKVWFGAFPSTRAEPVLVGCTTAPGFHYDDFELASREDLLAQYPGINARLIDELLLPSKA